MPLDRAVNRFWVGADLIRDEIVVRHTKNAGSREGFDLFS